MKLGKCALIDCEKVTLIEHSGGELILGDNSYVNDGTFIRAEGHNIIIGSNCKISYNVHMATSWGSYYMKGFREYKNADIKIGDNVWIGFGAMIRGGVEIGNWAIIGMGTIVTKSVPEYHVAVGNPAVDKGERKDADIIRKKDKEKL